jgi:phosphatidylserine synthase
MMTEPKGGMFARAGVSLSERAALFYGVCIWARVAIAFAFMLAANKWYTETLAIVLAAAVVFTVTELVQQNRVWWNRRVHAVFGFAVAVSAIVGLVRKQDSVVYAISVILLADVTWGVLHSFFVRPRPFYAEG